MLLILLASNSPGMLHLSSAGPVPEAEIIVMFFTQLQVYKASSSTPARVTKYELECLTRLRHTKGFLAFRRGTRRASWHICVWRTGVRASASALAAGRWSGDAQWQGIEKLCCGMSQPTSGSLLTKGGITDMVRS